MDWVKPWAFAGIFRRTLFEHYFDPERRVGRTEFWYFIAGCFVASVAVAIIDAITGMNLPSVIAGLMLLPPIAGMGSSRLRDTGRNGGLVWLLVLPLALMHLSWLIVHLAPFGVLSFLWFSSGLNQLLQLAAFFALVLLIYSWIQAGASGPNKYGPEPDAAPTG